MPSIPNPTRSFSFRRRALGLSLLAGLGVLGPFGQSPALAGEEARPPSDGLADCDGALFRPASGLSFRLADRSTRVDPSSLGLLVVATDADLARAAANAALQGLTLVDAGGRPVPFSTRIEAEERSPGGDVRLRLDVVRPVWEEGWYELRLALSNREIAFVQETAERPGGIHALRFRIGSEPLLRSARVCLKADGRRMVALDLSEPVDLAKLSAGEPAVLTLTDGSPCSDPAPAAAERQTPTRKRLYRLCPGAGSEATLRLASAFSGRRELRWNLPASSHGGESVPPCRDLPVE